VDLRRFPSKVDFPLLCWSTFRLSGIVSPANPSYTPSELKYQLTLVNKHYPLKVLFISKEAVPALAQLSEEDLGLSKDRVVVFGDVAEGGFKGLGELLEKHKGNPEVPPTQPLGPKGARKKLAFLNFSSGKYTCHVDGFRPNLLQLVKVPQAFVSLIYHRTPHHENKPRSLISQPKQ
jgi:acyl-CoA synthetase (AMP-forming)/AMP-acid ligase II